MHPRFALNEHVVSRISVCRLDTLIHYNLMLHSYFRGHSSIWRIILSSRVESGTGQQIWQSQNDLADRNGCENTDALIISVSGNHSSFIRGIGAWPYQTSHTENRKRANLCLLAPTPFALAMCPPTVLVVHHLAGDSRGTIFYDDSVLNIQQRRLL